MPGSAVRSVPVATSQIFTSPGAFGAVVPPAPASRVPSGANTRDLMGALQPRDRPQLLLLRQVPELHGRVETGDRQRPAVGRQREGADPLLGAGERARLRARGHGPQLDRAVRRPP